MNKKKFPEGFFTKDRPIAKPRYIDADGLREYWLTNGKNERVYNTNDFLDSIDYQPTADVQPIVHAHLVPIRPEYEDHRTIGIGLVYCDNCGNTFAPAHERIKSIKYCPYCGAKIDGDEHDNG